MSVRHTHARNRKKVLIGPKNFLLSKFELGYQKYAEFHADSKTVEKNAIKLLAKKLQNKIVEQSVCPPLLLFHKSF
jgi:hypothetical protein